MERLGKCYDGEWDFLICTQRNQRKKSGGVFGQTGSTGPHNATTIPRVGLAQNCCDKEWPVRKNPPFFQQRE